MRKDNNTLDAIIKENLDKLKFSPKGITHGLPKTSWLTQYKGGGPGPYPKFPSTGMLTSIDSGPKVPTMANGGPGPRKPIYVSDINDPRLKAYNDSLNKYNIYRKTDSLFSSYPTVMRKESGNKTYYASSTENLKGRKFNPWEEVVKGRVYPHSNIQHERSYFGFKDKPNTGAFSIPKSKEPVQPVEFNPKKVGKPVYSLEKRTTFVPKPKPEPKLKGKVSTVEKLPMGQPSPGMRIRERDMPNIQSPSKIDMGKYKVDYFDPTEGTDVQGGWHTRSFRSDKEAGDFMKQRNKDNNFYGPSMTQRVEYALGGSTFYNQEGFGTTVQTTTDPSVEKARDCGKDCNNKAKGIIDYSTKAERKQSNAWDKEQAKADKEAEERRQLESNNYINMKYGFDGYLLDGSDYDNRKQQYNEFLQANPTFKKDPNYTGKLKPEQRYTLLANLLQNIQRAPGVSYTTRLSKKFNIPDTKKLTVADMMNYANQMGGYDKFREWVDAGGPEIQKYGGPTWIDSYKNGGTTTDDKKPKKKPITHYVFLETDDQGSFPQEAKNLKSYISKNYPEEKVEFISGYGEDYFNKKVLPTLKNSVTGQDRVYLFGHHGDRYAGINNSRWGDAFEKTQQRAGNFNCYLGSCSSSDLVGETTTTYNEPSFSRINNFYYRPTIDADEDGWYDSSWYGVNPNAAAVPEDSHEGVLNAMYGRSGYSRKKAELSEKMYNIRQTIEENSDLKKLNNTVENMYSKVGQLQQGSPEYVKLYAEFEKVRDNRDKLYETLRTKVVNSKEYKELEKALEKESKPYVTKKLRPKIDYSQSNTAQPFNQYINVDKRQQYRENSQNLNNRSPYTSNFLAKPFAPIQQYGGDISIPNVYPNQMVPKFGGGGKTDPNQPYHPITNPGGYRPQNVLEKVKKLPNKEERYEPTQMVNDAKAILASADLATAFSGSPLAEGINFLIRVANSTGDGYTALRYAMDGQYGQAGVDAAEAILDLMPYRKGTKVFNIRKNSTRPAVYNKTSKLDKSLNRGLKVGKGFTTTDDFMHSSLGKFLFGDPDLIKNQFGGDISNLEKDSWLKKYGPGGSTSNGCPPYHYKNAKGECVPEYRPNVTMAPAASDNTSRVFYNPVTKQRVSTATTGQKKEDVATSTKAMGNYRKAEKKEEKARVNERKAALATRDENKPFTFPTGETKTWNDMNFRERGYVTGKALEQRFRFNKDEEAWYDEYLNPFNFIGTVGSGLGTAPYEAKQSNSNLPYLFAVGTPLIEGALGFDPLGGGMKLSRNLAKKLKVPSNTAPKTSSVLKSADDEVTNEMLDLTDEEMEQAMREIEEANLNPDDLTLNMNPTEEQIAERTRLKNMFNKIDDSNAAEITSEEYKRQLRNKKLREDAGNIIRKEGASDPNQGGWSPTKNPEVDRIISSTVHGDPQARAHFEFTKPERTIYDYFPEWDIPGTSDYEFVKRSGLNLFDLSDIDKPGGSINFWSNVDDIGGESLENFEKIYGKRKYYNPTEFTAKDAYNLGINPNKYGGSVKTKSWIDKYK